MKKQVIALTISLCVPLTVLAQKGGGSTSGGGGASGSVGSSGTAGASAGGTAQGAAIVSGQQESPQPAGHILNPNVPLPEQGITLSTPPPQNPNAPANPQTPQSGQTAPQPGTSSPQPSSQQASGRALPPGAQASMNASAPQRGDQAITAADQALLLQIRAAVFPQGPSPAAQSEFKAGAQGTPADAEVSGQITASGTGSATPVHFILKDGIVRLVGTVATQEERIRIEAAVRGVPGVIRIYDALAVHGQPSAGVTVVEGRAAAPLLQPTSNTSNAAPVHINR